MGKLQGNRKKGPSQPASPSISSVQLLIHIWHFTTPWTTACQAALSIESCSNSCPSSYPTISSAVIPFPFYTAAAAKSLQSCLTLCDPIDGSPARLPIPGILQARTLEWVAFSISNAWKWKVKSESEVAQSCPTLVTPWTAAYQAPPSMGFSRQKCWSGVPLPSMAVPKP